MKDGIHPKYHPVIFVDTGASFEFASRSTMTSKETREIDGVEHYVIRLDISSASHPFYTGKQRFVDTAGRIDKFRSKYGKNYGRRAKKGAAAAETAPAEKVADTSEAASGTGDDSAPT